MGTASLHRWDDPSRANPRAPAGLADSLLRRRFEDVEACLVVREEGHPHVADRRAFAHERLGGCAGISFSCASFPRTGSGDVSLDEVRRHLELHPVSWAGPGEARPSPAVAPRLGAVSRLLGATASSSY